MVAQIGIGVGLRPPIEDLRKSRCLAATGGKIPLQNEYEYNVALAGEVDDVLGDDGSSLCSSDRRELGVPGRSKSDLGYVDGVVTVDLPENFRCCGGEHLIDQESCHVSNAWRCSAKARLRAASARLRSIRSRISSGCAAA